MSRLKLSLIGIPAALSLLAVALPVAAQTPAPILSIQLLNTGLTTPLVASSTGATIARLVLDTTSSAEAVRISSLPFILTTGSGAVASTLANCRVVNEASSNVNLSSPMGSTTGLVAGMNSVALISPLVLPAGTVTTLSLLCDPNGGLVTGGTFSVSMNTANVSATGVTTGLPAVVGLRGVPPVVVPGLPNTGAGGSASTNAALLMGSLILAGLGTVLVRKVARVEAR